jgi:hypothetical protein
MASSTAAMQLAMNPTSVNSVETDLACDMCVKSYQRRAFLLFSISVSIPRSRYSSPLQLIAISIVSIADNPH